MSYLLSLTGLSRFADAEERERRKAKDARAEEEQRINRLWNSLINPAPKPFGRIGSGAGADIFPFPACPDRAALYQAQQTARSSCDPSRLVRAKTLNPAR